MEKERETTESVRTGSMERLAETREREIRGMQRKKGLVERKHLTS